MNNNEIDLSKYLIEEEPGVSVESDTSPGIPREQTETLDISQYIEKEKPPELLRHTLRTVSRGLETAIGYPGDIVSFSRILGEKLPKEPEVFKREPTFVQKAGQKIAEKLPTSEDIKKVTSYLSGGFTDPQSAEEKFADEFVELGTALAMPLKDPNKFLSLLKGMGKAAVAKGAKKGAEKYGFEEKGQAVAEVGTLLLMGLLGKKSADAFVSDQYKKAQQALPKDVIIPASGIEKNLEKLEKNLRKGGIITQAESSVLKDMEDFGKVVKGDIVEVKDLIPAYHKLNRQMNSKKLFDELGREERAVLKRNYDQFKDVVSKNIDKLEKGYPEFYKTWRDANQAFATIQNSKKISRNAERLIRRHPHFSSYLAADLIFQKPIAAGATVAGAGAVKIGELLNRVSKSPTLRKHYLQTLDAVLKDNEVEFVRRMNRLEKELQKEENQ